MGLGATNPFIVVGRSRVVQQVERRVFERNRSESLHKEESRRYVNSNIYSLLSNDGEHEENYERAIESIHFPFDFTCNPPTVSCLRIVSNP